MRQEGWEQRLNAYIDKVRNKRFKWGSHDCSLFAVDCVDAICKTNFASEWRSTYKTEKEAYEALEARGGFNEVWVGYGLIRKKVELAKRGDIAFLGGDEALGVVMGDTIFATGLRGLIVVPVTRALYVWSIP